jgi:hypothetical protein
MQVYNLNHYLRHTPWSRILLEKITGSQLVKKFPAFYGARRFITAFTSARHLSLLMVHSMISFYGEEFLAYRTKPKLEDHLLVGCPRLLIQYIRSYIPNWRHFLHPQPEDAPCRGDKNALITVLIVTIKLYFR